MGKRLLRGLIGAAAIGATLCGGCGGGGSAGLQSGVSHGETRGTVSVNLQFPGASAGPVDGKAAARDENGPSAYAGNIPYGARSVRVSLTNPSTGAVLAPARIVTSPTGQNGVQPRITAQFAALSVGPVRVDVAAFPKIDGSGNAVATGSVSGQISAGQTTVLDAPMRLTIRTLTANPTQLSLQSDGDSAQITVTALDASNQSLTVPIRFVATDPDILMVQQSSLDPAMALVSTTQIRGATRITVVEPNSGLEANVPVVVR